MFKRNHNFCIYTQLNLSILFVGFPGGAVVKNLLVKAKEARDTGLTPGLGRYLGRGNDNPL